MTTAVLLAHGSPDPRSRGAVHAAAAEIAVRTGAPVTSAFLDHDVPGLVAAVTAVPPGDPVVVLPLLLSNAFHARVDVPAAVASLDRTVRLLEPVGHPPALLDDLLARAAGPTVVVAAGTRVGSERAAFGAAVAAASARTRVPAVAAYATGPGRRVEDATRPGGATVVGWLLAPGRLLDAVHASARDHGCRTLGHGLLHEDAFLDAVAARLSTGDVAAAS